MKFAKLVFLVAGIYGLIVLLPAYFTEIQIGRDFPPAITHPEYYYGFVGVGVAFQVLFIILSRDPSRYRPMMIPAIIEKFSFVLAAIPLSLQHRIPIPPLIGAGIDLILGVLFAIAYLKTTSRETVSES